MQCKFLLFTLLLASTLSFSSLARSETDTVISVSTTCSVDHGLDFSHIKGGPLSIQNFIDKRDCLTDESCHKNSLNNSHSEETFMSNDLTILAREILANSFRDGQAALTESDQGKLSLSGTLIEGSITDEEVIFKIELSLNKNAKSIWKNSYLGKSSVSNEIATGEAVNAALNKAFEELMYDDYFVMELID